MTLEKFAECGCRYALPSLRWMGARYIRKDNSRFSFRHWVLLVCWTHQAFVDKIYLVTGLKMRELFFILQIVKSELWNSLICVIEGIHMGDKMFLICMPTKKQKFEQGRNFFSCWVADPYWKAYPGVPNGWTDVTPGRFPSHFVNETFIIILLEGSLFQSQFECDIASPHTLKSS